MIKTDEFDIDILGAGRIGYYIKLLNKNTIINKKYFLNIISKYEITSL